MTLGLIIEGILEFCRAVPMIDRWMQDAFLDYRAWRLQYDQKQAAEAMAQAVANKSTEALQSVLGRDLE